MYECMHAFMYVCMYVRLRQVVSHFKCNSINYFKCILHKHWFDILYILYDTFYIHYFAVKVAPKIC